MREYKILIIDDDSDAISFMIDSLEQRSPNYVFFHAINGIAGIEAAQKRLPDLILTDWQMPGLSGIDTIKRLKEIESTKDIPIIMVTGVMISSNDLAQALNAGAIDFIRKPIDKLELHARTNSMLTLSDYFQEIIGIKNRELTSTTMNILQNNEFYSMLLDKLVVLKNTLNNQDKAKEIINEITIELNDKVKGDAWQHFETYFNNVNPGFFNNLVKHFPDLTATELKLAAFIRLNLSSKEISSILFITPQSIKTARFRLRKKLGLIREDNLTGFLHQF